jgi:transcription elongation factor Elf1
MTDTLKCPRCGARDSVEAKETNDGDEMVCASCGYRFYPPEDRHQYRS